MDNYPDVMVPTGAGAASPLAPEPPVYCWHCGEPTTDCDCDDGDEGDDEEE